MDRLAKREASRELAFRRAVVQLLAPDPSGPNESAERIANRRRRDRTSISDGRIG